MSTNHMMSIFFLMCAAFAFYVINKKQVGWNCLVIGAVFAKEL